MALKKSLILRRLRSSRLEGRTTLVQPDFDFFTRSKSGGDDKLSDVPILFGSLS
jgi:hypothetical protein